MLITLTAPSGGGKEFLKKALLLHFPNLVELCWTTTRSLRPGEIHGVTREQVSMEEFRSLEHKGNLLFIQELFGGWYGIRREYLQSNAGYSLTEFHIDNVMLAVKNSLPILAIALVPQEISFLRERLERRGTETPTQIDNRVKSAEREIAKILNNRSSFSLVVEFSRDNEHTVVDRVWAFLKTHIPQLNSENQEKI